MPTYALRIILDWVEKQGLEYYYNSSGNFGYRLVEHGIRIKLGNNYEMSVQTHTDIVCDAFAETAIIHKTDDVVKYNEDESCPRWNNPEQLFEYILEMKNKISNIV